MGWDGVGVGSCPDTIPTKPEKDLLLLQAELPLWPFPKLLMCFLPIPTVINDTQETDICHQKLLLRPAKMAAENSVYHAGTQC